MEPLSRDLLAAALEGPTRSALARFEIFQEIHSTNAHLLAQPAPSAGSLAVALSEYQTAGRGRRGRSWSMPFGAGVMMSVGWHFAAPPADLSALSLAVGVAVREALQTLGVADVTLKWPNDLVWQNGKLGGILVEVASHAQKSCYVVVGIGVNVRLDEATRSAIQSNWGRGPVDVTEASDGQMPSRNQLAAAVVNELHRLLDTYHEHGFEPYRARWIAADALAGQRVRAVAPAGDIIGRAAGVAADGALLVRTEEGTQRVTSGEVRVQEQP